MNYRSVADLARCVRENLHRIPDDIDLVVGIPRSGLLAANLIALGLNLKLIDLQGLLDGVLLPADNVRLTHHPHLGRSTSARHVLIVDDSIQTGASMARVRALVKASTIAAKVTYCAVYATGQSRGLVDIAFEEVLVPRTFEWNVMHRKRLAQCCVDIDGVLCPDPSALQNDDGAAYAAFLDEVMPSVRPTYPIGHLVTARLQRYRGQTEAWLSKWGIEYRELHMLDLPDAAARRQQGPHASFKATVYRQASDATLFIESSAHQAARIAQLSGKPVLCYSTQTLIVPGLSIASVNYRYRLAPRIANRFRKLLGRNSVE